MNNCSAGTSSLHDRRPSSGALSTERQATANSQRHPRQQGARCSSTGTRRRHLQVHRWHLGSRRHQLRAPRPPSARGPRTGRRGLTPAGDHTHIGATTEAGRRQRRVRHLGRAPLAHAHRHRHEAQLRALRPLRHRLRALAHHRLAARLRQRLDCLSDSGKPIGSVLYMRAPALSKPIGSGFRRGIGLCGPRHALLSGTRCFPAWRFWLCSYTLTSIGMRRSFELCGLFVIVG